MAQHFSNRRTVLKMGAALGTVALSAPYITTRSLAADPIKVGCLLDLSGPIGAGGKGMLQATQYAVKIINDQGGLLGRPVALIHYDTQSSNQLYTQYAQQLALQEEVVAIHGGITSSAREAIRPLLSRFKIPYFYNTSYEGGVCDRNIFCCSVTPAQTISHLGDYSAKNWGKKLYIVAADYNFGQIMAKWMTKYTRDAGGSVLATDFFPLDVSDFSTAISSIQRAAPDAVFSALVGTNHIGFYRQWAAAGMNKKIPMTSSSMGLANDLVGLDTSVTDGIVTCHGWYSTVDTPASKAFTEGLTTMFGADIPEPSELGSASYEGMMFWAEGVKKAGTTDRMAVIEALETGISVDGPAGKSVMDPATHHVHHDAFLAEARDRKWNILATYPGSPPSDTAAVCDLIKHPNTAKQFVIDVN